MQSICLMWSKPSAAVVRLVLGGVRGIGLWTQSIDPHPISVFSETLWIKTGIPKNQVKQQVGASPYYRAYLCPRKERDLREHKFKNP